jgi:hypothetical protein
MFTRRALLFFAILLPGTAQQRDFLRADEIDQVRLAQEPNIRMQLYLGFAEQRLAQVEQAISLEKTGRSKLIHDLLEDYTSIIEAIDTVSDDALKRKVEIGEGIKAVADAEKGMLARLEKLRESNPKDIGRYQFALDQAIDTTRDSFELASADLQQRSTDVQGRVKREVEQREEMMRPEDVKAKRAAEQKETEQKRKVPTLRRKGEAPKER